MDTGNKRYIFERKTLNAPVDFSGYLNGEEIAKIEAKYGKLIAVANSKGQVIKVKN